MLMMTMRMGARPRVVASTTPRPIPLLRRLLKDPGTVVTRGSTFDNAANLSPSFLEAVKSRYEGTRLGRQELYAEVLDEVEGALWKHDLIDKLRRPSPPPLRRTVVAVDPSGSAKRTADEAGIVVAGIGECLCKGQPEIHAFVLDDLTGRYSPRDMGAKAVKAYHDYRADRLVAEDNFGGAIIHDLVTLIDPRVAYKAVHASRGKLIRAEPVAALYEQGKVHHCGLFREMEDEMCHYAPLVSTESPGRLDALVWALTDLMLGDGAANFGASKFKPPAPAFSTAPAAAAEGDSWDD
jgi:phage terminase large subunit-like protein